MFSSWRKEEALSLGYQYNLEESREMEDSRQLAAGFFALRVYVGNYIPDTSEMAS